MTYRTVSVAAKAIASSIPATALAVGLHAFAQQPSTNPPPPPAQAAPGPDTAKTKEAPGKTEQNGHKVELIYSPWTKYCTKTLKQKASQITAAGVCFTAADGHLPSGQKLVIALLIETEGAEDKLLRVTLPLGVALIPGARIVIDEKEVTTVPYGVCLPKSGCMADYKADTDLIAKLKKGRTLVIQAFDKGQPISFSLPLSEFAKAYDGPPSDPTSLNEQSESLSNELQRHPEDHLHVPGGK